jgi:hypothetical protein
MMGVLFRDTICVQSSLETLASRYWDNRSWLTNQSVRCMKLGILVQIVRFMSFSVDSRGENKTKVRGAPKTKLWLDHLLIRRLLGN